MIGPGLPNPFEFDPLGRGNPPARNPADEALDAAIDAALRREPLDAPPPLLYAAVMQRVRREPRPVFRITWLDLALSLFAAGMLLAAWVAWRSLPPSWVAYMRLLAVYQAQKLWHLDFPLLAWTGLAALLMLAGLAASVVLLRPPAGRYRW